MTDGTGLYERNQKALSKMSFLRFLRGQRKSVVCMVRRRRASVV